MLLLFPIRARRLVVEGDPQLVRDLRRVGAYQGVGGDAERVAPFQDQLPFLRLDLERHAAGDPGAPVGAVLGDPELPGRLAAHADAGQRVRPGDAEWEAALPHADRHHRPQGPCHRHPLGRKDRVRPFPDALVDGEVEGGGLHRRLPKTRRARGARRRPAPCRREPPRSG